MGDALHGVQRHVRVTKSDGSTLIEGDAYHVVTALAPGAYPAVMLDERSSVACLVLITGWGDFEVLLYPELSTPPAIKTEASREAEVLLQRLSALGERWHSVGATTTACDGALLQETAVSFLEALTTEEPMTPEDFSLFLWWLDDIMVFWEEAALALQATDRAGAAAYRHAGRELMRELSAFKKGL